MDRITVIVLTLLILVLILRVRAMEKRLTLIRIDCSGTGRVPREIDADSVRPSIRRPVHVSSSLDHLYPVRRHGATDEVNSLALGNDAKNVAIIGHPVHPGPNANLRDHHREPVRSTALGGLVMPEDFQYLPVRSTLAGVGAGHRERRVTVAPDDRRIGVIGSWSQESHASHRPTMRLVMAFVIAATLNGVIM